MYVITGSAVNVRKEPSKDARILTQLSKGTQVDYVKRYSNDWSVINHDGQEAYVSSQYLESRNRPPGGESPRSRRSNEAWPQGAERSTQSASRGPVI